MPKGTYTDFNSIKVRLEQGCSPSVECFLDNFNSIKVRLELAASVFHLNYKLFQFHKGAIRTCQKAKAKSGYPNFNSIKVRLERVLFRAGDNPTPFQFHKGAIRTDLHEDFGDVFVISIP